MPPSGPGVPANGVWHSGSVSGFRPLLLIGAVVLAGGGIGYYFKIYKPKHEAPDLEDDYCEYEDGELEEIAEEPEDEDTPPWEEDTEE